MNKVCLIAITEPKNKSFSASDFIAYCARVSNPTNQINNQNNEKLIKYLLNNKHFSPFEMINIVMEISTTRDIARQILRHRSFTFQEFSGRYAEYDVNVENSLIRETRTQDYKNRQNSIETDDIMLMDHWESLQREVARTSFTAYKQALALGIAKEQARALLPEGLTPSKLYVNGTLRSWIHYCQLRMANGTQKEHSEIAKECWELLLSEIPILREIDFKNI